MEKEPANYADRIAQQESIVKQLVEDHEKSPSPAKLLELKRRSDTLLHLKNLAKGDPQARAKRAASTARQHVLDLVIARPVE